MAAKILRGFRNFVIDHLAEVLVAWVSLGFGLILLNPNVNTFSSSPSYRSMAEFSPESSWGITLVVVSSMTLIGNLHRDLYKVRWLGIVGLMAMNFFIGTSFWSTNPNGTGWWTYLSHALACFCLALRLVYIHEETTHDTG